MEAHRGPDKGWNLLGQSVDNVAPAVGQDGPARHGAAPVQLRQGVTASLRQKCALIADCIRSSTEVLGGDAKAARNVPWLGLLLWMCACAALFVSLIMRPDGLERERRIAARGGAEAHSSDLSYPVRSWTRPAGELGVFTVRHPPSR